MQTHSVIAYRLPDHGRKVDRLDAARYRPSGIRVMQSDPGQYAVAAKSLADRRQGRTVWEAIEKTGRAYVTAHPVVDGALLRPA